MKNILISFRMFQLKWHLNTHLNNSLQQISSWMNAKWSLHSLKLNSFFLAKMHISTLKSCTSLYLINFSAEVSKFWDMIKSYEIFVNFHHRLLIPRPSKLTSWTLFFTFVHLISDLFQCLFHGLSVLISRLSASLCRTLNICTSY